MESMSFGLTRNVLTVARVALKSEKKRNNHLRDFRQSQRGDWARLVPGPSNVVNSCLALWFGVKKFGIEPQSGTGFRILSSCVVRGDHARQT